MPLLPPWLLPVLLFSVWFLWIFAATAGVHAKELRLGKPKEQWSGVSIFPVVPLVPLCFWGLARFADSWVAPWGSAAIGALHVVLATLMGFTLVRDIRYCRRQEGA